MHRSSWMVVLMVASLAVASGCNRDAEASGSAGQPQAEQPAGPSAGKSAIARLAFVDKADACECTRKNIDKGWGALQTVLGAGNPMPVDRIHMDTQADQAAPLLAQRKIVAVPAVYLLDANGFVIDVLQGDLQETDLRKALQ